MNEDICYRTQSAYAAARKRNENIINVLLEARQVLLEKSSIPPVHLRTSPPSSDSLKIIEKIDGILKEMQSDKGN